jgi:hypothetical protein
MWHLTSRAGAFLVLGAFLDQEKRDILLACLEAYSLVGAGVHAAVEGSACQQGTADWVSFSGCLN